MSDTPRTDALWNNFEETLDVTSLVQLCKQLERDLAVEKKENQRYFLITSLCQTIANHDVGEKLDNPPISHPVVDAVLQLQAERDSALRATAGRCAMPIDTPRTDAATQCPATADGWAVVYEKMRDHARQLECELAVALRKQVPDAPEGYRHELVAIKAEGGNRMIGLPVREELRDDEEAGVMVVDASGTPLDASEVVDAINAVPKVIDGMISEYLGAGVQQAVLIQVRARLFEAMKIG